MDNFSGSNDIVSKIFIYFFGALGAAFFFALLGFLMIAGFAACEATP